ncbi:MAG: DUF4920 domain-containing protein [Tahibacter sp.]
MKSIALAALLCCAALNVSAHDEKAPPDAAAVAQDAQGLTYGALMPQDAKPVSIAVAAASPAALLSAPHAFSGRITEVCQQQGCWMVLEDEGQIARVFMHEHSFSVPKQATGVAVVYGTLTEHTMTNEQAEHLRSEGGKNVAQHELRIDALSVRIASTKKAGGSD